MICSQCQSPSSDGARFCHSCGAAFIGAQSVDEVKTLTSPDEKAANEAERKDELIGRTIEGRYSIDSLIGFGGMGSVYRVTRLLIGDEVAMKILHTERVADPRAGERFRREAQAAARLKHPNAVSIYDFGITSDGLQYLVMELLEGQSLRQIIKQEGQLSPSVATEITTQVCAALDEAHRQHIVHRDIKPDNIIINSTVAGLRVKVLDFGIAKLRDDVATHLTQTGSVMGTPHYMSPEQCLGEELDSRADIYSMGIVLYEMLCGHVPFNSPVSTAVVVQHVNQPPQSLRTINIGISPHVEAVVFHALEKQRDVRPATAGALARELTAAVHPTSVQAPSHSTWPQMSGSLQPPTHVSEETFMRSAVGTPAVNEMPATVHLRAAQGSGPTPSVRSTVPSGLRRSSKANQKMMFGIGGAVFGIVLLGVIATIISRSSTRNGNSEEPREVKSRDASSAANPSTPTLASPPNPPPGLRSFEFETTTLDNGGNVRHRDRKSAYTLGEDLGSGITLEMVAIPPGEFMMGSPETEEDRSKNEGPQHRVRIGYWFYMGKFEVTQTQWRAMMGTNPSRFGGCDECPVEEVSWNSALEFCRKLSARSNHEYRLPSEAEWEYAARAGTSTPFAFGDAVTPEIVNYDGRYPYAHSVQGPPRQRTIAVGSLGIANAFGLYDMGGNVSEWCLDWYHDSYSEPSGAAPVDGSAWLTGPDQTNLVLRGGSWYNSASYTRSALRRRYTPGYPFKGSFGFRIVMIVRQ
jgi:formylglycine-generating enzyme required for sulfatase activity